MYNGSILTGQDGRSNPDLIGHLNVCLAVSVSLDFIESVLTNHRSLLSEELVNFMLLCIPYSQKYWRKLNFVS